MKLAWVTDPHLDMASLEALQRFSDEWRSTGATEMLITGDLANGSLGTALYRAECAFGKVTEREENRNNPFFVLGNHDCYGFSVKRARFVASANASWLGNGAIFDLGDGVVLCGEDGWYDGEGGVTDGGHPSVLLSDFSVIDEFRQSTESRASVAEVARRLACESAVRATETLRLAAEREPRRILFATHVPPYRAAAWHKGAPSDARWAPWMVNGPLGNVLRRFADAHPEICVDVYCGHTHSPGVHREREYLTVHTGAAEYGRPQVAGVIDTTE